MEKEERDPEPLTLWPASLCFGFFFCKMDSKASFSGVSSLWKQMWAATSELTGPGLHDAFSRSGCCAAQLRSFLPSKLLWHISSNFKENPGREGQRFHKISKICCKNSVEVERKPNTREAQVGPDLWDRIYIHTTQTLSDPSRPQRTRDTSHAQAEMGTASAGSRQVSLTRSQGVSSPHHHGLEGLALLLVTVLWIGNQ